MDSDPHTNEEPANLRFLRRLVTTLTAVMILGLVVLIGLVVMRIAQPTPLALPEVITLPDGTQAQSFTQGRGWYAVITSEDEILIFDSESGALRQSVQIEN